MENELHQTNSSWRSLLNDVIPSSGSEKGVIANDEWHKNARITLERDTPAAPFAITCGIAGLMVHIRYFGTRTEAEREYEAMKRELQHITRLIDEDNSE